MNDDILAPVVNALDSDSRAQAASTLQTFLSRLEGKEQTDLVDKLALMMRGLSTAEGQAAGLGILRPFASISPGAIAYALQVSQDKSWPTRVHALNFLATVPANSLARARVVELLSDEVADVKNVALAAASQWDFSETNGATGETALRIIPDDKERQEALHLLDELDFAVHRLLDDGSLQDAPAEIAEQLILPKIQELKSLLDGAYASQPEVNEGRKRGLVSLGNLIGATKAFAVSVSALGNLDDAASSVRVAIEHIAPLLELLKGLAR